MIHGTGRARLPSAATLVACAALAAGCSGGKVVVGTTMSRGPLPPPDPNARDAATALEVAPAVDDAPPALDAREGPGGGQLMISPTAQNFGDATCAGSDPVVFTVTNTGAEDVPLVGVAASESFVVVGNGCGERLAPGSSCAVVVRFAPARWGGLQGALTVTGAPPAATATATLTGRTVGYSEGVLVLEPGSLDFGGVVLGETSPAQTVKLSNGGFGELMNVGASSSSPLDFSVSTTCSGTVPACGTCEVAVTFRPTAPNPRAGQLLIEHQGARAALPLAGVGLAAVGLVAAPTTLDFGQTPLQAMSGVQTVTVTNTGDEVTPVSATLSGTSADQFLLASACSASLVGRASCTISLTFVPTRAGRATANLAVSGPGAGANVAVTGVGVQVDAGTGGPRLELTPDLADFGRTPLGGSSLPVPFVVSNRGGSESGLLALGLAGDGFAIVVNGCVDRRLAPGGSCMLGLQFAPAMRGEATGGLTVTAAPGGSALAALRGTGATAEDLNLELVDGAGGGLVLHDFSAATPGPGVMGTRRFHGLTVGTRSDTFTVIVRNRGVTATGMLASITDGLDFAIVASDCARPLEPGEQCALQVVFSPVAVGAREGRLRVAAGGVVASLTLRGVGLALLEIVHAAGDDEELIAAWEFGAWPVDQPGAPRERFLVRARASLGTVGSRIENEFSGGFTKGAVIPMGGGVQPGFDQCEGEALEGSSTYFGVSCPIEIGFEPARTGPIQGFLVITTAAGESLHVSLTATGL